MCRLVVISRWGHTLLPKYMGEEMNIALEMLEIVEKSYEKVNRHISIANYLMSPKSRQIESVRFERGMYFGHENGVGGGHPPNATPLGLPLIISRPV